MSSSENEPGGANDQNRFARAANGRGHHGNENAQPPGEERGPLVPIRLRRPSSGPVRGLPPGGPTPEQTCLGCSLGLLAIAVCAAFWFWYFWRLEQQDLQRYQQQQRAAPRLRSLPLPATPRTYE